MQSEVLPKELQLIPPPTLPQARSYMFKQQSDLQEYDVSKGTRIRVNIPRLQRSYLMKESYLRFRLNVDFITPTLGGTDPNEDICPILYLDRCGAHGLFDRIEVYDYLGGTLIEQTQNIPALALALGDLEHSLTDFNTKLQTTQGYDGSNIQTSTLTTLPDNYELRTANNGLVISSWTPSENSTYFTTVEFTIPVLSFLGLFSDKYVPLHNGFSVDFFLNNSNLALVSRSQPSDDITTHPINQSVTIKNAWISNFEYCCQVMELGEQAESMVIAQEPLVMQSSQYRYFSDYINGSSTQSSFRLDLNLNVVSLRNIRWGMRPTVYQNLAYPSYGHRIRNFLNNWNFQYGSSYLPEIAGITSRALTVPTTKNGYTRNAPTTQTAPTDAEVLDYLKAVSFNQCYMELLKTVDSNKPGSVMGSEYMVDLACKVGTSNTSGDLTGASASVPFAKFGSGTLCGKFLAGLDTRLSKKNTVSGIDTNGLLVSINGYFDKDYISQMTQAILDVWAEYDAFIQVIPGVATTVTF